MKQKGIEIKVGLVIFICMVMLVALLVVVGGSGLFKKTYEVKARFALIDGLEGNATVRFAGVEVGKVTGIRVIPEEEAAQKDVARVEVTLSVDKDLVLHDDSKIRLRTLGLMGGKYVSITPGTIGSPKVKAGDVLRGEDPLEMAELMNMLASNREDIEEIIKNLKETTQNAEEFTRKINEKPNALIWGYKEKKSIQKRKNPT